MDAISTFFQGYPLPRRQVYHLPDLAIKDEERRRSSVFFYPGGAAGNNPYATSSHRNDTYDYSMSGMGSPTSTMKETTKHNSDHNMDTLNSNFNNDEYGYNIYHQQQQQQHHHHGGAPDMTTDSISGSDAGGQHVDFMPSFGRSAPSAPPANSTSNTTSHMMTEVLVPNQLNTSGCQSPPLHNSNEHHGTDGQQQHQLHERGNVQRMGAAQRNSPIHHHHGREEHHHHGTKGGQRGKDGEWMYRLDELEQEYGQAK